MTRVLGKEGQSGAKSGAEISPEFLFGTVMSTPVRLAYGLGPLIGVVGEHGIAVDPLLERAEIPRFALEEPSYRESDSICIVPPPWGLGMDEAIGYNGLIGSLLGSGS
jgi:hypothetical protein